MMTRSGRQLAVAHARSSGSGLLGDADPEFLQIHWHRSTSRQRTTPSIAAVGPLSITAFSAARCASVSFDGCPGALRSISPSGPWALNFITQSRTICSVTPPIVAASVRLAPS
jgi:hypothetical protein